MATPARRFRMSWKAPTGASTCQRANVILNTQPAITPDLDVQEIKSNMRCIVGAAFDGLQHNEDEQTGKRAEYSKGAVVQLRNGKKK